VVGNGLPLRQVFVLGAAAHNAPTNCTIHNAMSLGEQCLFLAPLQSTVQRVLMNRTFPTCFSFMYNFGPKCTLFFNDKKPFLYIKKSKISMK